MRSILATALLAGALALAGCGDDDDKAAPSCSDACSKLYGECGEGGDDLIATCTDSCGEAMAEDPELNQACVSCIVRTSCDDISEGGCAEDCSAPDEPEEVGHALTIRGEGLQPWEGKTASVLLIDTDYHEAFDGYSWVLGADGPVDFEMVLEGELWEGANVEVAVHIDADGNETCDEADESWVFELNDVRVDQTVTVTPGVSQDADACSSSGW